MYERIRMLFITSIAKDGEKSAKGFPKNNLKTYLISLSVWQKVKLSAYDTVCAV